MQPMTHDLDYLAARLHARRSRLAEAERLDALCRVRTVPELAHALQPDGSLATAAELQQRLVRDLAIELPQMLAHLAGPAECLLSWMLLRFHLENLKVMMRSFVTGAPPEAVRNHLVPLPAHPELSARALESTASLQDLLSLLPKGPLRKSLARAVEIDPHPARAFFLEAALDRGYFQELLARVERLTGEDTEVIKALTDQEVDTYHLMLVIRGRFHHGLKEELLPLHVAGAGISQARFAAMLADPDLATAAEQAVGRALEALPNPVTPAAIEAATWQRFLHLANRAFRRSHMGLGAVVGYCGIRRVEVANLITLCEGLRTGAAMQGVRTRLLPRTDLEAAHV